MKDYVIIVAAGSGSRMKSAIPKQFLELNGKPILQYTLEKFYQFDPLLEIIVVLNPEYVQFWQDLARTLNIPIPHRLVEGGEQRFHSVKRALESINSEEGIVAVHDAVRPLVSLKTIEMGYHHARTKCNAIPVVTVNESLRQINDNGSEHADRNRYRLVQTPQCFEISMLKAAYQQRYRESFTDDASVIEAMDENVYLYEGNRENIKITTAEDLRMAEALLSK